MPRAVLRLPEVAEKLTISSVTVRRWVKSGTFPKPIRLGKNTVAWRIADVENWLNDRPPVGDNP